METEPIAKNELERLEQLCLFSEKMNKILADIADKDEYSRVRAYIASRFDIDFPYDSNYIKKEPPKK